MPFVSANGIAIHHRVAGRRGAPHLVFLNSLGSDLRIWEEVVAILGDRFESLLFDMRGHGLTEVAAGPASIAGLADDLLALLDALGWRSASLVGLAVAVVLTLPLALAARRR